MRKSFPGHFSPTEKEFEQLWTEGIIAIDANVLLNLYRYTPLTREGLESALKSVGSKLFITHQAAKEFFRNRLTVTAGQVEEYSKIIKDTNQLYETLSNKKRHPFLEGTVLDEFSKLKPEIIDQLESQKTILEKRLNDDEILRSAELLFENKVGLEFDAASFDLVIKEGEKRYQDNVPPGFKDGKKDGSGDSSRKFGDLLIWKQLILKAKELGKDVIFVTDDKKDDWWLEQSGRTISPRPELIAEFRLETKKLFWMYSVDRFIEEISRINKTPVNEKVIAEIKEVSTENRIDSDELGADSHVDESFQFRKRIHPVLTENEILGELSEFLDSHPSEDDSVGMKYFVVNYLGTQNYEINHSYAAINSLCAKGNVDIFDRDHNGIRSKRIRILKNPTSSST